jgi:hypothetical protein
VSALDAAGVVLVVLGLSCLVLAVVLLRDVQEQREGVDRLLAGLEGARATRQFEAPTWRYSDPWGRVSEPMGSTAMALPIVGGLFKARDLLKVVRTGETMRVEGMCAGWVEVTRGFAGSAATDLREGDEVMWCGRVPA